MKALSLSHLSLSLLAHGLPLAIAVALTAGTPAAQDASEATDWDQVLAKAVDHPRFAIRRAATGKLARASAEAIPAILRFEAERGRDALPLELVDALARGPENGPELKTLLRSWADDREFYWRAQALRGLARRKDAPSDGSRFLAAAEDASHLMRIEAVRGRLLIAPGFRLPATDQPAGTSPSMSDSLADWNIDFARRALEAETDPRARLRMALLLYQAGDGSHLGEVFAAVDRADAQWLDDAWGSREAVFAIRELRRLGADDFGAALAEDPQERIAGRGALASFVIQNGGVIADEPADESPEPAWTGGLEIRSCRNGDLHLRWTSDGRLGLGLIPDPDDLFQVPAEAWSGWREARTDLAGSAVHGRIVCDFLRILDPAFTDPASVDDEDSDDPGIHRKCAPGAVPEPVADWLKTLAPVLEENDVEPLADRLRARLPQFVSTDQGGK